MRTFFSLLFLVSIAEAQLSMLPEPMRPVPELPLILNNSSYQTKIDQQDDPTAQMTEGSQFTESQISDLAFILSSQFKKTLKPLTQDVPTCEDSNLTKYLQALHTSGKLDKCAKLARDCKGKISGPQPFLVAALCESSRYFYQSADHFFELATHPDWAQSPDYPESLFQRASYSLYGHHEDQVDGILAQMPDTNAQERKMWKALLQRVGEIDTGGINRDQINLFLENKIQTSPESFKGLLLSLKIRLAMRETRYQEAIEELLLKASEIQNPLLWYYTAYNTLYHGLNQNFAWSRKIYNVYNQYSHPWLSFPLENNTYNYTQIYSDICRNQLISEADGQDFKKIKSDLRSGKITISKALEKLDLLRPKFNQKADFLTTYAGLLSLQGFKDQAFEMYWKAHQLCPYFNRAHWGLAIEKKFKQYAGRPDYEDLISKIDRELENRIVPEAIATYIVNWSSLNPDVQKRVVYGSRIWLPYMEALDQNEMLSYIKYGYDLLSESPLLSELRDLRIGGINYPHDNRLWDDVRGVGGSMVVADLAEVYQAAQGDYNLLGHEIAHQFQYLMEKIDPKGLQCIVDQYAQAKLDKNFPDAYSSQNKEEHFAQGVTYYMVPADSPARFGLNQSWVRSHNPAQFRFVESIDQARGDFSLVECAF